MNREHIMAAGSYNEAMERLKYWSNVIQKMWEIFREQKGLPINDPDDDWPADQSRLLPTDHSRLNQFRSTKTSLEQAERDLQKWVEAHAVEPGSLVTTWCGMVAMKTNEPAAQSGETYFVTLRDGRRVRLPQYRWTRVRVILAGNNQLDEEFTAKLDFTKKDAE